jgi:hypothetical protein
MKNHIVFLLLALLTACAPTTADQLRAGPAGVYSFKVVGDYQTAYQRALAHAGTCYQRAVSGINTKVRAELHAEDKRASISIENVHAINVDTLFAIDIAQTDLAQTEVSVFYALSRYEQTAFIIGDWIINDSGACQPSVKTVECVCYLMDRH